MISEDWLIFRLHQILLFQCKVYISFSCPSKMEMEQHYYLNLWHLVLGYPSHRESMQFLPWRMGLTWLVMLLDKRASKAKYNRHFKYKWILFQRILIVIHTCHVKDVCQYHHFCESTLLVKKPMHWSTISVHPLWSCELVQHSFVVPIISFSAKKGPVGGEDHHVLFFLLWGTDNILTKDEIICAVPIEFYWKVCPLIHFLDMFW